MPNCVGLQRSWVLRGIPSSAGAARRLMRDLLTEPIHAEWLDDAQLAVTEIVTNVVLHAYTDLVLTIRLEHGRLCVQIRDDSSLLPVEWERDDEATTGRGIALVRQLTSAYGAQLLPGGGKVVWFVMGPPEVGGSPWPFLEEQTADSGAGDLGAGSAGEAVHVVMQGVPAALWRSAAAHATEMMGELALHQAEHPTEMISRADLAAAQQAMAQGVRGITDLTRDTASATPDDGVVSLWVTPRQSAMFALLRDLYRQADRLSDAERLLRPVAPPQVTALSIWACDQVIAQVSGAPGTRWAEDAQATDRWSPGRTTAGWDKGSVAGSPRRVVAVDGRNRIVAVSASLATTLGWQVEDLVGRRLTVVILARLRDAHVAGFGRLLATGESHALGRTLELPMLGADGKEILCRVHTEQVGTKVGHPVFAAQVTPVDAAVALQPPAGPSARSRTARVDLTRFAFGDLARTAGAIRRLGEGASSLQVFADRVCRYLYDHLLDEAGDRQTLLVRFHATLSLAELPVEDQQLAAARTSVPVTGETTCVTLLAGAGHQPSWNDRTATSDSRVGALTDDAAIGAFPMLAAVVEQLGIDPEMVLGRRGRLHQVPGVERYGVFHVVHGSGGTPGPAQAFSQKHGVVSQFGFGGVLPNGGLFGVMLFSRVPVAHGPAQKLETLAHSVTLGAFARTGVPVFEGGPRTDQPGHALTACQRIATQKDVLTTLLRAHERVAADESDAAVEHLERANFETQRYAALARTLQTSLLPADLPVVPHLQVGAAYRPAGDGSEVGGDFYDLFPTLDGRFGFVLGDVSGKGAQAAALTALARHTVRAAAFYAPGTCEVLGVLDLAVAGDHPERFLTALFAFLSVEPGQVTMDLALGGHPQPLVVRADGRVEAVGVVGGALGLFADPSYAAARVVLRSGDVFVAYSDGVTEARRGDEEFGEDRLRALLAGSHRLTAPELAARIETAVVEFQLGSPRDDIAVVAFRCP